MGGVLVRAVISFGVVLGVMALVARAVRGKLGVPSGPRAAAVKVEVLARQSLSRNASVAVVRAGGKGMVIGITDSNVTVLADVDPATLPAPVAVEERKREARTAFRTPAMSGLPAWKGLIAMARESTVRR